MAVTPMFPLGSPLLPGAVLRLQVFEPRYQALVSDLRAVDDPVFGVVLIERGSEVGGGDVRSDEGTLARVVEIGELPGGRKGIVAFGAERLRVVTWLSDDPYPRADVETLIEPAGEEVDAAAVDRLVVRVSSLLGADPDAVRQRVPTDPDPGRAVFQLAALAPIGPSDQQKILVAPAIAARIAELERALDDADAVREFRSKW